MRTTQSPQCTRPNVYKKIIGVTLDAARLTVSYNMKYTLKLVDGTVIILNDRVQYDRIYKAMTDVNAMIEVDVTETGQTLLVPKSAIVCLKLEHD
jgi:hypothetical protein